MQVTLDLILDLDLFDISEYAKAQALADETGGNIYSWQTACNGNWLEKGIHRVNALGLVVLPKGLPNRIDMPDDAEDDKNNY